MQYPGLRIIRQTKPQAILGKNKFIHDSRQRSNENRNIASWAPLKQMNELSLVSTLAQR